jgi:hypothetical protein
MLEERSCMMTSETGLVSVRVTGTSTTISCTRCDVVAHAASSLGTAPGSRNPPPGRPPERDGSPEPDGGSAARRGSDERPETDEHATQ